MKFLCYYSHYFQKDSDNGLLPNLHQALHTTVRPATQTDRQTDRPKTGDRQTDTIKPHLIMFLSWQIHVGGASGAAGHLAERVLQESQCEAVGHLQEAQAQVPPVWCEENAGF